MGRENGITRILGRIKIEVRTVISEKWPRNRKLMFRPTPGSLQEAVRFRCVVRRPGGGTMYLRYRDLTIEAGTVPTTALFLQ